MTTNTTTTTTTTYYLLLVLVLLQPLVASSECGCGGAGSESEERNGHEALKLKLIAVASILAGGLAGVVLPILGKRVSWLSPENSIFSLVKAFSAGVILATGFIHVLPDSFESLTSPCLAGVGPWDKFPFTGLIAMVAAIGTLMIDTFATGYYRRRPRSAPKAAGDEEEGVHVHTHASHGHAHGAASLPPDEDILRHRIVTQVLELGIVAHSVIIGLSLGASESPSTIKPLVAALTFHQLFEGMGLGGCITQGKFKSKSTAAMVLFFSLTTPFGIVLGMGVSNTYNDNSPTALAVQGCLNAAAAGILIYMALVDLLAADFMNPKMTSNLLLQIGANVSLVLGAAFMSLLAIWA